MLLRRSQQKNAVCTQTTQMSMLPAVATRSHPATQRGRQLATHPTRSPRAPLIDATCMAVVPVRMVLVMAVLPVN